MVSHSDRLFAKRYLAHMKLGTRVCEMSRLMSRRANHSWLASKITNLALTLLLTIILSPAQSHSTIIFGMPAASLGDRWLSQETNTESTRQGDKNVTLELSKPIECELAGDQVHSYGVLLTAGQYLHVVIDQRGIDVVVTLFGSDGKKLAEVDSPNGTQGPEPVWMIAEATGNYRLEVRSIEKTAAAGRYEVKIEELRTATEQDRSRVTAEQAFTDAKLLQAEGTAESLKRAIRKYEDSLPLFHTVGDRRREAMTLNKVGEIYNRLGEKQKALNYFGQALSLLRSVGDRQGEIRTVVRISEVYNFIGEMQKALDFLDMALQLNRAARDPGGEATVLTAFGSRYISLGEKRKALDYYDRALKLWRAVGDRSGEAKALGGMAKACIFLFQARRALGYYEQALALQRTMGDRGGEAHTLHGISWTYHTLGEKQKALDYNSQALSLMQAVGDRWGEAAIFTNLGWISELSGERLKALEYYNQALPVMQATGDWDGEANTLFRLANVELDLSHLPEARAYIESAIAITESLRSQVANRELRASYAATVQRYHEFYIDLLFRLHQHSPSEGYDAAALQASERARARGLLDLLTEARVDIRQGVEQALLDRERDLRGLITAKTDRRIRVLNVKHTEHQAIEATKELEELVSTYQEVEAKIRASSPRYAGLTQSLTLTLPEIQQLLDADTVLLEYALGDVRSFLWAVTSDSMEIFALEKRPVIEAAAKHVYKLLTARTKKIPDEGRQQKAARIAKADVEYYQAASELSRLLLAPVALQLGKKRLLIVSDWALQHVPFAALPELPDGGQGAVSNTRTKENGRRITDNYRPLILEHEIVNLPSASTLALLRRDLEGRKSPTKTVAVFADPVFEATDFRVIRKSKSRSSASKKPDVKSISNTAQNGNPKKTSDEDSQLKAITDYLLRTRMIEEGQPLARLPHSRKEAMTIASLVPEGQRRIALDFDVNYQTVASAELGEYRFVHFATHGLLDTKQPELSGILLSLVDQEGRPQESGILRLGDVYNLKLPVDMVSLSACETALGKSIKGEGLVGLTRGFMYAGAPRVLVSLWKVDDVATADLMKLFYEGMLGPQRLRPAAALRQAQKQMWQKNKERSPFYWAAFVLQGEWR